MEKIKPYLFWVICGIILLIELIIIVVVEPVNKEKDNVYKAAKKLNDSVKTLETGYYARANTELPPSFAIDEVSYFSKLQTEHLVSQNWMNGLEQVQRDLEKHKANVEDDLRKRSAILHEPIKQTELWQVWYSAYEDMTFNLLAKLREQNQLALNGDPFARADAEEPILREDANLRKNAGFYTKGDGFPATEEWPTITRRFRISEAIIKATLSAEASLLENVKMSYGDVDFVLPPDGFVRPQLMEVNWGTSGPRWDSENTIPIKGGKVVTCKVKFKGSVSALLAVTAKLESLQQPIFVIYGSQWTPSRNSRSDAEKRVDTSMEMTLNLGILDYQGGQP